MDGCSERRAVHTREQSPLFKTPGKSSVLTQLYKLNHTSGNGLNQKETYNENGSPMKLPTEQSYSLLSLSQTPCKASTPVPGTPQRIEELSSTVSNPFEKFMLSRLHVATFSPSVFSKLSTPSSDEKSTKNFRWSIDQMALLHPADIDENMLEHQAEIHDDELDNHAQKTIDNFFSSQLHAPSPSPWTQSQSSKPSRATSTSCSVIMESACDNTSAPGVNSLNSSTAGHGGKDVACQTALSLPANFDLQKILGEFYTNSDECNTDSLSTSSLRRKLFCQGDTESAPASPVKPKDPPFVCKSRDVSPQPCLSPQFVTPDQKRPLLKTAQFSSSPIVYPKTGSCSRQGFPSGGHDHLDSPELSPIMSSKAKTPATGGSSRSGQFSMPHTPSCFPLQATPSSGRQTLPFMSPNMSPINSDDSKMAEKTGKNNHVQSLNFNDETLDDDHDSIGNDQRPLSYQHSPFLLKTHKDISPERSSTPTEDCAVHFSNSSQVVHSRPIFHQSMFGGAAQLSVIRENQSTIDMEIGLSSANHDTGYHTCSLQSTHQETKSHSSIANHDIPNVSNHDLATSSCDQANHHSDLTDQLNFMLATSNDTGIETSITNIKESKVSFNFDKENLCPNIGTKFGETKLSIETRHMDCLPSKVISCPLELETMQENQLCGQKTVLPNVERTDLFSWDPIGSSTPSRRHLVEVKNAANCGHEKGLFTMESINRQPTLQHENMQH